MAAARLAALAKEDVPEVVMRAYDVESLRFGREYLIPKPFDPRVLLWVAPAVAWAAMTAAWPASSSTWTTTVPGSSRGSAAAAA